MSIRIDCLLRKDAESIALSNCYLKIFKFDNLEKFENVNISQTIEISEMKRNL